MAREEIANFARKALANAPERLGIYLRGPGEKPLKRRMIFARIEALAKDFISGKTGNRWTVMPGLRGTGKTTLLSQLYFLLKAEGVPQDRIIYVSADELVKAFGSNIYEFIEAYEDISGLAVEELQEKAFFLVDEAHYDKNWAAALKTVFDRSKHVFIIATGSNALALQANPDVARRVHMEKIFPLTFAEYVFLKRGILPPEGAGEKLYDAMFFSGSAKRAFSAVSAIERAAAPYFVKWKRYDIEDYLSKGTLPFSLELKSREEVFQRLIQMLEKVVYDDIAAIFPYNKETLDKVWNLLLLLSSAEDMSLEAVSSRLGLGKPTVHSVLTTLEKSEILFPIKAFGRAAKQARKTPKYAFIAPVIKATLLWESGSSIDRAVYGRLFEDIVAFYLYKFSKKGFKLSRDSEKRGADFIITRQKDNAKTVVEVGYGQKGPRQVRQTMKKVSAKYGIVIYDGKTKLEGNILFVPKRVFLLC
ncbi:MAG: AAA family ATPase [Nanoarchaeota archaeon]|nr:AAA family ATPase [Nanoarchaeota archaeon]